VDTRRPIDFSGKGDPAAWRYDVIWRQSVDADEEASA
jgi:hypothetical protein